jgi:hypothetical protein
VSDCPRPHLDPAVVTELLAKNDELRGRPMQGGSDWLTWIGEQERALGIYITLRALGVDVDAATLAE